MKEKHGFQVVCRAEFAANREKTETRKVQGTNESREPWLSGAGAGSLADLFRRVRERRLALRIEACTRKCSLRLSDVCPLMHCTWDMMLEDAVYVCI